jgi:hypothetical protein
MLGLDASWNLHQLNDEELMQFLAITPFLILIAIPVYFIYRSRQWRGFCKSCYRIDSPIRYNSRPSCRICKSKVIDANGQEALEYYEKHSGRPNEVYRPV